MKSWERQIRLYSGLVLAAYIIPHMLNHALGVFSIDWMESMRQTVSPFWDSFIPKYLLYMSFTVHFIMALYRLYQRRSLKMPTWEWVQTIFGLSIVPLLVGHAIATRGAAEIGGLDPNYWYVLTGTSLKTAYLFKMPLLIIVVWVHLVFGLHFWLRLQSWYLNSLSIWLILSVSIPVLSLCGYLSSLWRVFEYHEDPNFVADVFAEWRAMDEEHQVLIPTLESKFLLGISFMLAVVFAARVFRSWRVKRRSLLNIEHANGRVIAVEQGQTLLEAVRQAGIAHASVCGGRARCTTCRVRVGVGKEYLPEPGSLESAALARIGAEKNVRLACQLRPLQNLAITPLIDPNNGVIRAFSTDSLQGTEQEVVCMFVDMRGSTRMGEQILPYDVVYILNQFFNELSVALIDTSGHYAQFAGDGLMALYGLREEGMQKGSRDALSGAQEMFRRLDLLNKRIKPEFDITIQMGIGIHAGTAIVGRMGPPQSPLLTAIGDNINIAARLESMTKIEGCDVIVSIDAITASGFSNQSLSRVTLDVRGRAEGIEVVKLMRDELSDFLKP